MGLRNWPLAFSIATAAGFSIPVAVVAKGVMSLVEYELLVAPARDPPRVLTSSSSPTTVPDTTAVLHRNPFDSETGPLDVRSEPVPAIISVTVDPLAAPSCEALSVYSTLESTDPYWSSAVIQGEHDVHGQVRRPGDRVDGREVVYIGFNPRIRSPSVWFQEAGRLCQGVLFDGKPRRSTPAAKPPKQVPKKVAPKPAARALPKALADKIRRRSPTEFDVDRSFVDAILADYAKLMRGTRMRPVSANGKLVGLRVSGVRPDSLLGRLGWVDGDQVQSINGFALTSPDKALEAYARLRTADHLVVLVLRRNKPVNLDYRVR